PLLVQCRLHIRDTRENYVRRTRRSIDRARSRRTASARRVGGCTVVVRNAAPACLARRKNRGISTGSRKARSLQSIQYAGPACAMPGKTIDGEKIDEAIR
ncbi:hypothetical protein, partial [Burkholderia cenocepacia]|uniref:hypothetical protein n=1 Tax=Burkholderia cenocepacia TaxID=95486 RepID=UPI0019552F35